MENEGSQINSSHNENRWEKTRNVFKKKTEALVQPAKHAKRQVSISDVDITSHFFKRLKQKMQIKERGKHSGKQAPKKTSKIPLHRSPKSLFKCSKARNEAINSKKGPKPSQGKQDHLQAPKKQKRTQGKGNHSLIFHKNSIPLLKQQRKRSSYTIKALDELSQ